MCGGFILYGIIQVCYTFEGVGYVKFMWRS